MTYDQREKYASQPGIERAPPLDLDGPWKAVETASKVAEPLAKAYARSGFEMVSLVGRRASAYAALPSQMRELRNPRDLVTAQFRFWEQARRDYLEAGEAIMSAWKSLALAREDSASASEEPRLARDILAVPDRVVDAGERPRMDAGPRKAA